MNIIIAGGTGFIGQALVKHFYSKGDQITIIGRNETKIKTLFADIVTPLSWEKFSASKIELVQKSDLIINLTGANIGAKRWTQQRKQEILDSRIIPTQLLAQTCAELKSKSPPLFNTSAVGVYGLQTSQPNGLPKALSENDIIDFNATPDFLATIGRAWEKATHSAVANGVRVINMRFGVVLGKDGGVLNTLKTPFLFFMGGPMGSGQQPFPWIALPDLVKAVDFLIHHSHIQGPVNFVAPNCVTQKQLAQSIGRALHRPSIFPMPAFLLKLLFGQMAEELLLNGQNVKPDVLLANDFKFDFPDINSTLEMIFTK